jgi:hypothetical protein
MAPRTFLDLEVYQKLCTTFVMISVKVHVFGTTHTAFSKKTDSLAELEYFYIFK